MKITKIEMTAFGKFQNRTIPFHAGCNLIYGPNESGKSTIHTFLAAMLFGLDPSRGRGVRNSLYQRYLPWNMPGDGRWTAIRFFIILPVSAETVPILSLNVCWRVPV